MALVITSQPVGELLTVEDAKRHLRLFGDTLDDEVTSLIRAARDYCERYTQRTLREAVTRTETLSRWWPYYGGCDNWSDCRDSVRNGPIEDRNALRLPWPPLLGVSSVTYYDADNVSQTLSSTNYLVELSTDGGGRIVWAWNATIPIAFTRPDAITIAFTTGYADLAAIPPTALQAMKTKLTELWGSGTDNEIKAAKERTDDLLGKVEWPRYA